jgi:hypothetical protein
VADRCEETVICCGSQESYDFLNQSAITTLAAAHGRFFSERSLPHSPKTAGPSIASATGRSFGFSRIKEVDPDATA